MPYNINNPNRPYDLDSGFGGQTDFPGGQANYSPAANGLASQVEMETIYDRPLPEQVFLMNRHLDYVGFATMLKAMGTTRGVNTPTTGHYEKPWIHDLVEVGSVVTPAGGAGNNIVVALDSSAMYDTGVDSGGSGVQASYPVEGDVIELFDRTQCYVLDKDVSVTPHQLTLRPLKAADDLDGKVVAGEGYAILYNLWAEGDGLPNGRAPRIMKYSNTFGVVKTSFGSTGFELTNAVYHETVPGQADSAGDSIYVMIEDDELRRYEKARSNMILFGQQADNITKTVTATGVDTPVIGTEGFIDFSQTEGAVDGYTVGTYDIEDFDLVSDHFFAERPVSTNDMLCLDGPEIHKETENTFTNVLQQNLAPFVDRLIDGYASYGEQMYQEGLSNNAEDATLLFGYSCIKKNGVVYHLKRMPEFHDIRRVGAPGYEYSNWRITIPFGWVNDLNGGGERATIGYEYKHNPKTGYSRENVFGSLPGAGVGGSNTPYGTPVTEDDTMKAFMLSHIGGHFACGNAIVTQKPA